MEFARLVDRAEVVASGTAACAMAENSGVGLVPDRGNRTWRPVRGESISFASERWDTIHEKEHLKRSAAGRSASTNHFTEVSRMEETE